MKLLIVDDEELTRQGLVTSIDWASLGISQVFQAEDGMQGLITARAQKPEIILCDVRMPHMDGIHMMEQIENELPDSTVIFMSGYSDKEYLKAAIKLKAVNYVEKPINLSEIQEAVDEAVKRSNEKKRTRHTATLYSKETASRFAQMLTRPYEEHIQDLSALTEELQLDLTSSSRFTTFLVQLKNPDVDESTMATLRQELDSFLEQFGLQAFYVQKHSHYQLFHILDLQGNATARTLEQIGSHLCHAYSQLGSFQIAQGETVNGLAKAYHSYSSAVILMQNCFFFSDGTLLQPTQENLFSAASLPVHPVLAFTNALTNKQGDTAKQLLEQLHSCYYKNRSALVNQVKDLYYKLFIALQETRKDLKLPASHIDENPSDTVTEYMENCFTYEELHETLATHTQRFFENLRTLQPEDPTIYKIKNYINEHYSNGNLSVKDIGDSVFLSTSYVCTYFKNETGMTLNQYLTEYRMERAKRLLSDPNYQITEIAAKVGYSDGNYFSKSFKKSVGLSPSEYREKMLQ